MKPIAEYDFYFRNEGTIIMLYPQSKQAKSWVENNIALDSWQNSTGIAIEPRYFLDIVEGIKEEGLTITNL